MQAEREIENLIYTYAERVDAADLEGVADLFAHGRIWGRPDPPPEMVFEGRDAVLALYRATVRIHDDGTLRTKHVTSNLILEVDDAGGSATGRCHYTVTQATDSLPLQIILTGHYHDTFHRIGDTWWFDTRVMFVDQIGDVSQHMRYRPPGA